MNAGEVIQSSYYRGDAALGGGFMPAITPDMSAWQKLADYTFVQKKAEYEAKKKEVETAAVDLSKDLAIDWSKMVPKQREAVEAKRNDFVQFIQKNPGSVKVGDPGFFEYQQKKNELTSTVNGAVQRQIEYAAGQAYIDENASSEELKKTWQAELDSNVLGPMDKIEMFPGYYKTPLNIAGPSIDLEFQQMIGDEITTSKGKIADFPKLQQQAVELTRTLAQKDLGKIKGSESLLQMKDMAGAFNTILGSSVEMQKTGNPASKDKFIFDENGKVLDLSQRAKTEAGDPGIELIKSIQSYNEDVARYNAIRGGRAQAFPINWQDGISDNEVAQMIIFGRTNSGTNAEDVTANPISVARTRGQWSVQRQVVANAGKNPPVAQPEFPEDFALLKPQVFQLPDGRHALPLSSVTPDMLKRWNLGLGNAAQTIAYFESRFNANKDRKGDKYVVVTLKPDGKIATIQGKNTSISEAQQRRSLQNPGTDNKTTEVIERTPIPGSSEW